jgi:hypothetical protein
MRHHPPSSDFVGKGTLQFGEPDGIESPPQIVGERGQNDFGTDFLKAVRRSENPDASSIRP